MDQSRPQDSSNATTSRKGTTNETSEQSQQEANSCDNLCDLEVNLHVRWLSPAGRVTHNCLMLKPIHDVTCLEGVSKSLVARAYPQTDRPEYLTSTDYYHFTPAEECMSASGEIEQTEFRLVAMHDGWEYTILEMTTTRVDRRMLVTVVEFESTAIMLGHLGIRVSFIAYPVVSIAKDFINDIAMQLRSNPNFKGLMFDKS